MALKTTTFTVMVTVTHDEATPAYGGRLSEQICQALEEGTRGHAPFVSAVANTWIGDRFAQTTANLDYIRKLHADVAASAGA